MLFSRHDRFSPTEIGNRRLLYSTTGWKSSTFLYTRRSKEVYRDQPDTPTEDEPFFSEDARMPANCS